MPLSQHLTDHLQNHFTRFFQEDVKILSSKLVAGAAISQACLLKTSKGSFFMKLNAALYGLDFFEMEAKGLATLANTGALKVSRPLFDGKFQQQIYLVMEYLETGAMADDFWEDFGRSLASLHQNSSDSFGLDYDNFIGKLHQCNNQTGGWQEFYKEHRIMKLAKRAQANKLLDLEHLEQAERLCNKLNDLIPAEKPSLLHGDLWNGNYLVYKTGLAAIFDPSVYYGHREMDIAMTRLFGGFDKKFYQAYNEEWPLMAGYDDREPLHQLYPLLVHLLQFGGQYRNQVTGILKTFS